MNATLVTIGACLIVVLIYLIIYNRCVHLLRKAAWLKDTSHVTKTYEELLKEYHLWNLIIRLLMGLFLVVISLLLGKGMSILSSFQEYYHNIEAGHYFISPPLESWVLVSMPIALILAILSLYYPCLFVFGKQRLAEYVEFRNKLSGTPKEIYKGMSGSTLLSIGIGVFGLILTLLNFDQYVKITFSSFTVNQYFSIGEREYSFDEVKSVRLIKSFKAPNGKIRKYSPYYIVNFKDGYSYNFHKAMHDLTISQQEKIAYRASWESGVEIEVSDPYPRSRY